MDKKLVFLICFASMLVWIAPIDLGAATLHWTGAGGDKLWDNPANWETGAVPTAGDEVYVDVPAAAAPNGPVIQDGMEAKVSGLACEVAGEPTMTMTGGTLDVGSWIWWGDGANCHGTFTMTGGTITTGAEFELGWGGGEGTWIMTGGTVNAKELVIPTATGRAGQLYLHGGAVNVGSDGLRMSPTGLIDITVGTLTLEGDLRAAIETFIRADQITAYAGAGRFDIDFDLRNPGLTTVTAIAPITEKAYAPLDPADGQTDVYRDTNLTWVAGLYANTHDVYLGTAFEDVNNATRANPLGALVSQGQETDTYDPPGHLELGRTYYWRIDEVNGPPDYTIFKGDVWSFTTEPYAYAIENIVATSNATSEADAGPENTINGSGLDADDGHSTKSTDMWLGLPSGGEPVWIQYEFSRVYQLHEMWVWNYNVEFERVLGFGLKLVTIECSADGASWTTLGDFEFAQGSATSGYAHNSTVDFGGAPAKYVRLTVNSGWGALPQYGLSEVRFFQVPAHARAPEPSLGETGVTPDVVLSWRAGRQAARHEVYFSADEQAVIDGTAQIDAVTENRYRLDALTITLGTTYYWRIDEVNDAESPAVWEGDLWSFTTSTYLVVDDFESYTDDVDAGQAIFQTWIDGWTNGTGSMAGYLDAPFVERMVVHEGRQSMPVSYDNQMSPWYSEIERAWWEPQNWTVGGAEALVLYVRGDADNDPETLYIALEDDRGRTATVTHPNADVLTTGEWQAWQIPLDALGANGVDVTNVAKLYIGAGDRDHPAAGGSGLFFVDDIRVGLARPEQ